MLTLFQALILGLLQGITELFPISSLGHTVIVPTLLGWRINQQDPAFLAFIIITHLATALVLLGFYWKDWMHIISGVFRSLKMRQIHPDDTYARIGWLLVVSSVPVGVLGILFEETFTAFFAAPLFAGIFLMGNGVVLYATELLRRRRPHEEAHNDERIAQLSWAGAIKVGCLQCLALLPGFSRTGSTLSGGLLVGLSHQDAAHYSFLLATPVIFAAAVLKIPEIAFSGESLNYGSFAVGILAAFFGAYASVRFLTNYFKTKTLTPFALYCLGIGLVTVVSITLH